MEITIHEEKISHFTFHGKKKGQSRVTKIPFTTLLYNPLPSPLRLVLNLSSVSLAILSFSLQESF